MSISLSRTSSRMWLAGIGGKLSGAQWDHLVALCRELKKRALVRSRLAGTSGSPLRCPGRGSGMVAGSQVATMSRAEIEACC